MPALLFQLKAWKISLDDHLPCLSTSRNDLVHLCTYYPMLSLFRTVVSHCINCVAINFCIEYSPVERWLFRYLFSFFWPLLDLCAFHCSDDQGQHHRLHIFQLFKDWSPDLENWIPPAGETPSILTHSPTHWTPPPDPELSAMKSYVSRCHGKGNFQVVNSEQQHNNCIHMLLEVGLRILTNEAHGHDLDPYEWIAPICIEKSCGKVTCEMRGSASVRFMKWIEFRDSDVVWSPSNTSPMCCKTRIFIYGSFGGVASCTLVSGFISWVLWVLLLPIPCFDGLSRAPHVSKCSSTYNKRLQRKLHNNTLNRTQHEQGQS